MRLTTAFLGDELGKYYMQSVFGPDAKKAAEALVLEIEESLKTLLLTEKWLDKVTYDAAVEKLSKVKNYIGGPDDVPPLPFELQADAFFDNVKKLMQLGAARAIQSVGKPVDEKAWNMFPSTVNAYYDPSANKMVFPAAILQPPFYSADHFPVAANFARIGMVMGHELSHGFDDQGRNYDSIGSLRSWWTPSVSAKFAEKAKCLAAQYSKFPVVSTEDNSVLGTVNGNLTLGENIADNGGIRLAYEAYHLWKSTFESPPIVPSSKVPPETGNPKPVAVSSPDKLGPKPTHSVPSGDIPAVTAAPHLPVSVPAPTKAGPSGHNPVVPVPPPVLPGPGAATPEATQTEPNGGVSVISKPPLVPESQPAGVGPGEVIPHKSTPAPGLPSPAEQTPAPSRQESATKAPTVTPVSPKLPDVPNNPTPPPVSDVPNTPNTPSGSTPPTVPDVPHTPSSPNILPPSKVPAVVPQPQPQPGDVSPDNASKDKRTKKEDEPSAKPEKKDHTEKQKRQESEDETGKPDSKVADDNSHVSRDKSKHKSEDRKNKGENDDHAKRSTGDDGKVDRYEHRKHENKEERREERKERKKERKEHRHHEKEKHRYHHDEEKHRYHHDEEKHRYHHDEEYHGHHHKREKEGKDEKEYHECRKEDADCGSERPTWTLSESKYPFSGGDTRMQSMVMKLARAIVYPNDPVADDRLFFTAFAQNWCEKRTPGYAELLRMLDPHSPGKWRVNGPLMNYDKFAKAFSCSLGTPMNPEKKCVVW
ncbi:unnamed protein product [Peronospora belbahrii]|nr:unnamed protein product [Peronospora belbahrii]